MCGSKLSSKSRWTSASAALRVGFVLSNFCTPLTRSYVFAMVALVRRRGVSWVPEVEAFTGDVQLSFLGGLRSWNKLNFILLYDIQVERRHSGTICPLRKRVRQDHETSVPTTNAGALFSRVFKLFSYEWLRKVPPSSRLLAPSFFLSFRVLRI